MPRKASRRRRPEDIIPKYNSHSTLNLYIDSSDIHNDGGVELTATSRLHRVRFAKLFFEKYLLHKLISDLY